MIHANKFLKGALVVLMILTVAPMTMAAKTSLTIGTVLEPPHLDPTAGAAAAIDEVVYANVFEGLTRIDRKGEVKPALAEKWTLSADQKEYTFFLHKGVTFHDGQPFDADDVVFSLNRARSEDSVNAQKALFGSIVDVKNGCAHGGRYLVTAHGQLFIRHGLGRRRDG